MINITIPQYDDALAQSLKAQVDLLSGQGEFSGYGTLQQILERYERPLRMSQAQTNTDVFRQTLLGDRVPITRSEQARRDAIARAEQIQRDNQAAADMVATAGQPFSDIVQGPTIPQSILERNQAIAQQAAQQAVGQDPLRQATQAPGPSAPMPEAQASGVNQNLENWMQNIREAIATGNPGKVSNAVGYGLIGDVDEFNQTYGTNFESIDEVKSKVGAITRDTYKDRMPDTSKVESLFNTLTPSEGTTAGRRAAKTQVDYGGTVESDGRVKVGEGAVNQNLTNLIADYNDIKRQGDIAGMIDLVFPALYENFEEYGFDDNPMAPNNDFTQATQILQDLFNRSDSTKLDAFLRDLQKPEPIYRKNEDGTDFVVPKDEQGNFITESASTTGRTTQVDYGGTVESDGRVKVGEGEVNQELKDIQIEFNRLKREGKITEAANFLGEAFGGGQSNEELAQKFGIDPNVFEGNPNLVRDMLYQAFSKGDTTAIDEFFRDNARPGPVYKKNADGTDFVVPKDEEGNFITESTTGEIPEGGTAGPPVESGPTAPVGGQPTTPVEGGDEIVGYERAGTGLVDLVGDRRMALDPATGLPTDRMSGFDEEGNFLGLSALAEDIARGNLSRQRSADLADIENLSDRYQEVMKDYKPATVSGITGAKELIEEQKENLTSGGGAITVPTGDTYAGDMAGVQVADPLRLSADTQFSGELGTGAGSLRSALLEDAKSTLGDGLTDRERRRIEQAFKGQATMMGRTFDPLSGIAEAKAQVMEDNQRRMQNRGFAQSALAQESGLQQGDLTRGMAQELDQANLDQRADLVQADLDFRQGATNQAQRQQANQFNVGARLDAESENERLRQAGLANYINAVGNLSSIEQTYGLDPFRDLLGRGGGNSFAQGQQAFGSAGYGLDSSSQFLNPESGVGFISQMATNQANLAAANATADAYRDQGLFQGGASIVSSLLPSLFPNNSGNNNRRGY